jgi:hypothetical protein
MEPQGSQQSMEALFLDDMFPQLFQYFFKKRLRVILKFVI